MDPEKTNVYVLELEGNKFYVGRSDAPRDRLQAHFDGAGSRWTQLNPPIRIYDFQANVDKYAPSLCRHVITAYRLVASKQDIVAFYSLCPTLMQARFDEDKITKQMMAKFGIDNVRGGSYCAVELSAQQIATLERELRTADESCFNCGKLGHFASQCTASRKRAVKDERDQAPAAAATCNRCGRPGHLIRDCFAKTHADGTLLQAEKKAAAAACARCGRSSHAASECYASIHIDGSQIHNPCARCGRTSHFSYECYASIHINGSRLEPPPEALRQAAEEDEGDDNSEDDEEGEDLGCARCGRDNHTTSNCYARTDYLGAPLGEDGYAESEDDY